MSGGYFDYNQYRLEEIADEIGRLIENNNKVEDFGFARNYAPETLEKFRETAHALRRASDMVQRVDWLASGDDGEEHFHSRWKEEVRPCWAPPSTPEEVDSGGDSDKESVT